MRTKLIRAATGLLALAAAASVALPAYPQTVTPVAPANAPQPSDARFDPQALDQLLAPVALYPDQLLGQILMAATYPLEVVQAARWLQAPQNAARRGDSLAAALEPVDWDPSVKALVPFPQVLAMMNQHLDWLQNLGDAFIAQQNDVMDSVQRLRRQAAAAGNLRSTPQQVVTMVGPDYVVQPASPTVIYVPVYNPSIVYGAWRYPLYPPFSFAPPPGLYVGPMVVHGVGFSIGFTVGHLLWGWDRWDWRHHRLDVDHDRYNTINRYFIDHDRRPRLARDVWQHDAYHRRGVGYRSATVQQHFRPSSKTFATQTRGYRGFENRAPAASGRRAEAAPPRRGPVAPTPPRAPHVTAPHVTAPHVAAPHVAAPRPPTIAQPHVAHSHVARQTAAPHAAAPARRHAAAPAFQSFARGAAVRADAKRGRASRQTIVRSKAPKRAPARAPAKGNARPAPSGHGGSPDRQRHGTP